MNLEHCRKDAKRLLRTARGGQPARLSVSERGTALEKAGAPRDWRRGCARVHAELEVNITRSGVIWLPIVAAGPSQPEVEQRIGRASLTFFQEPLELDQR